MALLKSVYWIHLTQNRDKCRTFVNMVMKFKKEFHKIREITWLAEKLLASK